jgi:hypothetical protein
MSKNALKKICAAICALSLAAQFAVMPVNAAYINEDYSNYLGDYKSYDSFTATTTEAGQEGTGSIALDFSGTFTVSLDAVFKGSFPTGSTVKNTANSTYFYMGGSGSGKVGSHLMVDAVNDDGFKMHIKSTSVEATTSSYLSYDKKYNFKFKFSNVASGTGASVTVEIYDYNDNGELNSTPVETLSGGLRNFSSSDGWTNNLPAIDVKVFTTDGVESSVEVSNIQKYSEIADEIATTINSKKLKDTADNEFALDKTKATTLAVANTVKSNGSAVSYTAKSKLTMKDGSALPEGITFDGTNITADVLLEGAENPGETKKYELVLTSYIDGYEDAKVTYPIVLTKEYTTASEIISNFAAAVEDSEGNEIATGSDISDDVTLDKGNAKVSISWSSSNNSVISAKTGVVLPQAEDTDVTLTAKIGSAELTTYYSDELDAMSDTAKAAAEAEIEAGTAVLGKTQTFTYTVKGIKSIVDAAIDAVTFVSNDDSTKTVDLTSSVNEDFVLPTSYADSSSVQIVWTEDSANIDIVSDNVAQLVQKTRTAVSTSITGTFSYVKNNTVLYETTVDYPFTIDMTKSGTANKYIVRCDMAASSNFSGLPDSGSTITSSIDLPTTGLFGSTFDWSSDVPTCISNTGKVTRQTNSKRVNLTATISKGSVKDTYTISNLYVPSKSGSTSSSSSTGSSSSNSTVSSTGNRASSVSYKGDLGNPTSLEKGDITTAEVSAFSDLSSAEWAKEAITSLYNNGIINGKTASTFAPNDDITRAEFAKIVVKAFGLEDTSANTSEFSDVSPSDWYYTSVASAYNSGIIKGYENGEFGVNDKITRQDMAVIIYRAAQAAGKSITAVKDGVIFDDAAGISTYAAEAVDALQKAGVINGMTETTFAPKSTATRAQAAQMIYGIVK